MLGTILTEWGAGKQLLERILVSDENIERFTEVTASMCAHYGFHGWLLNIENEVEPELVDQLIKLTKSLTEAVKKKIGSEGVVLWYDSVTIKVRPSSMRLVFVHQLLESPQLIPPPFPTWYWCRNRLLKTPRN